jgi:PAS domain S-box-containing protein
MIPVSNPEENLREYEKKYQMMTNNIPMGMFRLGPGPDCPVIAANPMLVRMLGYSDTNDLMGMPACDHLVPKQDWTPLLEDLENDGIIKDRELRMKHKDGSDILVKAYAWAFYSPDNRISQVEGVIDDITERKVLEMEMLYHESELNRFALALTQANKKLNLLSNITRHDILNQLTGLSVYLELMKVIYPDPKVMEYMEIQAHIAKTITSQIQFTRDYQEIGITTPKWYHVRETIESAAAPLPLKPGTLTVSTGNLQILADPLLEKVFYNLVENALRHGRGQTQIKFSNVPDGDHISIVCEDNGEGVPDKFKEAIFNRQYFKHTGFGLFLSREILSITGISIKETGEHGKGARFEMVVPRGYFRNQ